MKSATISWFGGYRLLIVSDTQVVIQTASSHKRIATASSIDRAKQLIESWLRG